MKASCSTTYQSIDAFVPTPSKLVSSKKHLCWRRKQGEEKEEEEEECMCVELLDTDHQESMETHYTLKFFHSSVRILMFS
mmetsp:Transcript_38348/g.49577  ORF Transcript_38348/g.49577 Transcript_38348/m.49577 type:complete len:80 (+) Transcript_38348:429-668(+)